MKLDIFDSREVWWQHIIAAAGRHGIRARRIFTAKEIAGDVGFIRLHPARLAEHRALDAVMRDRMVMIQDRPQVEVYEDKTEQFRRWGKYMPWTAVYTDLDAALAYDGPFPVMSKANEGASSVNVRFIETRDAYVAHARQAFGDGIKVNRCADRTFTTQKGYLYVQQFIPHDRTYRVNVVGRRMAIFERFNYPDRPVAQTGNTNGVCKFTPLHNDLLAYAWDIATEIGSTFTAFDILKDGDQWKLIETSQAWPWNPTDYKDVPLIGGGTWGNLWHAMFEELKAGSFGSTSR